MPNKLSASDFIERASEVHGGKYDYSRVVYVNNKEKVCIVCPEHGEFYQTPDAHMRGGGCQLCYNERRGRVHALTKEDFVGKAKKIHGDVYDYSLVDYVHSHSKVEIICQEHGSFFLTPNSHLCGRGCPLCSSERVQKRQSKGTEKFKADAYSVHGDKYDYSKAVYVNNKTKMRIICPKHGDFLQNANNHLRGVGCPHCRESKGESRIASILKDMGVEFVRQYKVQDALFADKVKCVFADFYIPSKRVFIEYNGEQHYEKRFFNKFSDSRRNLKEQQERDSLLEEYCSKHGVHLIVIPYWEYPNIDVIIKREFG